MKRIVFASAILAIASTPIFAAPAPKPAPKPAVVFKSNADLLREANRGKMVGSGSPGSASRSPQLQSTNGGKLISNGMGSVITLGGGNALGRR